MLIAPSWGGVLNGLLTLLGAWDRVRQLSGWIGRKGIKAVRMIGIFNGLIPCGLVYMAIAGAVTSGHILSGAAFMRLFGPGTVPLMAFTGLADQSLNPARRSRLRRFAPALMLLIAALFRLRGLQSEVPDPLRFWEEVRNIPMCR
jgi:sulfite exporter TauE/SafE